MDLVTLYRVEPIHALMVSVLVLYLGLYLNRKIRFLSENYIPPAVTGGLLCSGIVAVVYAVADLEIDFDMQIRDVLLLVFFSTIGLSAKLRTLVAGGKALSGIVAVVYAVADLEIDFDMQIRDVLLLVFFSTIGLSAKLRTLVAGGKALAVLVAVAAVFLILQDTTGVAIALAPWAPIRATA
jgi:ESS family glutamate:Na+ symporter